MARFDGKVILVSGGARGQGAAESRLLIAQGAKVVIGDVLEKEGVIHDLSGGEARVVFWYGPTRTAVAFHQPWGTSGLRGDAGWIFSLDRKDPAAPFVEKRLGIPT